MSKLPENDDLQDIYQGEIKPALSALRQDFKPWHKPRKHFVRLKQWCHETASLIKERALHTDGELRYLGLPGEDMLDIRVLEGVCRRAKVQLCYLGFNSDLESPQLNLSRHQINLGGFIHQSSVVISDRIETLTQANTMAYKYAVEHGPFDVINLDLCNSVMQADAQGIVPNLEAIRTLCDIQLASRRKQWLLFLTTRTQRESVGGDSIDRLFKQLLENMADTTFLNAINETLDLDRDKVNAELNQPGKLEESDWLRAYVLCIAKWLLHYMMKENYKVAVRMLPSYTYSVNVGPDMTSLAFRFEPPPANREDDTGLTQPRLTLGSVPSILNEIELAVKLLGTIAQMQDIDDMFNVNRKLRDSMFRKTTSLLSSLGYDISAYKNYAFSK